MNNVKNLQIDTKKPVCYTQSASESQPDMHLENRIEQTNRSMLTTTAVTQPKSDISDAYNDNEQSTMTEQTNSVIGGNMEYHVSHEGKFISVFSNNAPEEKLREYAARGYKIACFIRGNEPVIDVMRSIVLGRCK